MHGRPGRDYRLYRPATGRFLAMAGVTPRNAGQRVNLATTAGDRPLDVSKPIVHRRCGRQKMNPWARSISPRRLYATLLPLRGASARTTAPNGPGLRRSLRDAPSDNTSTRASRSDVLPTAIVSMAQKLGVHTQLPLHAFASLWALAAVTPPRWRPSTLRAPRAASTRGPLAIRRVVSPAVSGLRLGGPVASDASDSGLGPRQTVTRVLERTCCKRTESGLLTVRVDAGKTGTTDNYVADCLFPAITPSARGPRVWMGYPMGDGPHARRATAPAVSGPTLPRLPAAVHGARVVEPRRPPAFPALSSPAQFRALGRSRTPIRLRPAPVVVPKPLVVLGRGRVVGPAWSVGRGELGSSRGRRRQ